MGRTDAVAYDPSDRVRRGHLPSFAREEKLKCDSLPKMREGSTESS